MERLRVAVIGRTDRGDWGHAIDELWADAQQPFARTQLLAVADESQAGLVKAAARLSLDASPGVAFRDWQKMLTTVRPDIVAICMRQIDCHAEMAIAAAAAGAKGIFMEKPFVQTRAQADAVIAACQKANTKLSLALVNRHSPAYAAARDLIEDGRIGRVLELRGRGKEDARGGGEDLWVLGCHVLDMMVDLGGTPQWCEAAVTLGGRAITKADAVAGPEGIGLIAGDSLNAVFGLADGPIGFFSSVREAGLKQPNFGLTVVGTKGAIHIRPDQVPHAYLREAPLWRVDKEFSWRPIGPEGLGLEVAAGDPDRQAQRVHWAHLATTDLIDAISADREPETGMYAGRTVVEMTAAIYESALSGTRIEWPLNPLLSSGGNPLG
ncbi:MAG: Gfo/Idh/MocA family oxidoreductase [Planctomycetia bacterium]|nr:Gfo/Idh/MocA family oxidoreductase [Planctomycetia bacterium]